MSAWSTNQTNENDNHYNSAESAMIGDRNSSSNRGQRQTANTSNKPAGGHAAPRSDYHPSLYCAMHRHLPPQMMNARWDEKCHYIRKIIMDYAPIDDYYRNKIKKEYREAIMSSYRPMHQELYMMNPTSFFVPSFLKAISENTEEGFRKIISEPSPGVLTFEMLQPAFCKMMLDEMENIENWLCETRVRIMRPNTMNAYGAVLDDFGMEAMLGKLMEDFICPMSTIFFPEVGGATLDSHHGYIVEYGTNRDSYLGFHVDDSEVTLNVCLGEQFSGGELFFRGVRCEKHVNVESQPEEIYDYSHVPGRAVLHRGRHRHGALSTTSGHRVNMLLWCQSSVFREMKKYEKKAPSWCGVCQREKEERRRSSIADINLEIQKLLVGSQATSSRTNNARP
ncbi:2-oxoglutarate and iron-dependent oxygenase domain-containing protein CP2-like [Apium graveolens]|uniref:2-oxoglutarate and iron-dependent oxygenase domain-containing protein CP2-like n=1 Tax=Apium graveolens TaxID=4045 RepID=UPI003D7BFDDF